jgi:hypothetical protein
MSPVFHTLRFEARADNGPLQTPTTTLDTMRIQQATVSPTFQPFVIASNTDAPPEPTWTNPAQAAEGTMGVDTRLGFAMIPVAVAVCGIALLIAFWLRGRQMRKALRDRAQAPFSEKGYRTPSTSLHFSGARKVPVDSVFSAPMRDTTRDTNARSIPVHIMEACRTPPMHTPRPSRSTIGNQIPTHERWPSSESVPIMHRPQYSQMSVASPAQSHEEWPRTDQTGRAPINMTAARYGSPMIVEPEESPIDGSSPFRLTRGNSPNRNTLGSAIASTWPLPPPRARMNLSDPTGRIPFPRLNAEENYNLRPLTHVEVPRRDVQRRVMWDEGNFQLGPDPGPTLRSDHDGDI